MSASKEGSGPTTLGSARFRAVIGMSLLIMTGFGLIIPSLPQFAKRLGVAEAGVGIILSAFSLTRLVGDFAAGSLLDRFGERTVTAAGAAIVGLSSLAAGASQTFWQLVVFRGIGGFGSAFFLGGLMAYLVGTTSIAERGRAMSIFQASFGMGFLLGPPLGGLIIYFLPVNAPLYVYGVVCLVCVPLTLRALGMERVPADALTEAPSLEESPLPAAHMPAWRKLRPLLGRSAYVTALATSAVIFIINSAQQTLVPGMWRGVFHQAKGTSGIPFAVTALFGIAVMWHAGAVTDRRGRKAALVPALGLAAIGTAGLGFASTTLVFLAWMAFVGVATGYMRPGPSAIVADVATPESKGVAVSGYRIAGDLGALLGPVLTGVAAQYGSFRTAFVLVGAVTLVVFGVALFSEETFGTSA